MIDLTGYSDRELTLHVYNDEFLYNNRFKIHFKDLLNEFFVFTQDQWDDLENDINEELSEEE